ncbi:MULTISPECIES: methionine aminopeptidase [unclassified Knoellia]|uniref:methionine aminopeptidase n=1 Tax=Knoellia altitudinis TaxID=3404795 RepID=UPI00361181D5
MAYWYNIATKEVETDENRSRNDDVMGPYDTEDDARNALASAARNTEQWDAEDRAWEGEKDLED